MRGRSSLDRLVPLIEELAAVEHQRWARWQRYLHDKCKEQPDGSLVIPAELVARWERQRAMKYADLDNEEKDSDRDQVRKYLPIIANALDQCGDDCELKSSSYANK